MKRLVTIFVILLLVSLNATAQRHMDNLGRGLVAIPTDNSNYITWRRLGTEYYDVTYNLYRDGTQIASNLTKTSYDDTNGSSSSRYQVAAVVKAQNRRRVMRS